MFSQYSRLKAEEEQIMKEAEKTRAGLHHKKGE
jgi:hypothetical protein